MCSPRKARRVPTPCPWTPVPLIHPTEAAAFPGQGPLISSQAAPGQIKRGCRQIKLGALVLGCGGEINL